jgi:hypothetical protein
MPEEVLRVVGRKFASASARRNGRSLPAPVAMAKKISSIRSNISSS